MKLTHFTDIGLRALMYLGAHADRPVPTPELAERLNVSRDHLMKSLQALDGLGLVSASRGRGGGFSLTPRSLSVRIGKVVRSLEPESGIVECFQPTSACPLTGGCRLTGALEQAVRSFFAVLNEYTLGDLVDAGRPRLVEIGGPSVTAHH